MNNRNSKPKLIALVDDETTLDQIIQAARAYYEVIPARDPLWAAAWLSQYRDVTVFVASQRLAGSNVALFYRAQAMRNHDRPGLQGHHARDKKRQDAYHQETDVADLEELGNDLAPVAPAQRQRLERSPKQRYDFSDMLEHHDSGAAARAVFFPTVTWQTRQRRPSAPD